VIADMLGQVGSSSRSKSLEWGFWLDRIFKQKDFQLSMIGHAEAWDIGIYANPNYYFQYDSQEFRDAYNQALKATTEAEQAKWFGLLPGNHRHGCRERYLFASPSLSAMKAELMNCEELPTIALDCTEVW